MIITMGVLGVDGVWTTASEGGSEDDGGMRMLREAIFGSLAEVAAAVRAVLAFGDCFALFHTLWSTVKWIVCPAGLVRR